MSRRRPPSCGVCRSPGLMLDDRGVLIVEVLPEPSPHRNLVTARVERPSHCLGCGRDGRFESVELVVYRGDDVPPLVLR